MRTYTVVQPRGLAFGLVTILVLVGLLAGCGSTATPAPAPAETPAPATEEPVVVATTGSEPASVSAAATFQPLDSTVCVQLADDMGKVLGSKPQTSDADFVDYISGESGTGCQASAAGTGADFGDLPDIAAKLEKMLADDGWKQDIQYQADGPTGTAMGFKKDQGVCLLSVNWEPARDADCPEDQPISACDLKPAQKEFTIVLDCAQAASR